MGRDAGDSRAYSAGTPRLSHWQRLKKAFKPTTKATEPQPPKETATNLEILKVHPNAPTWLVRARAGGLGQQQRNADVWNTTLVSIPDEVSSTAEQGEHRGSRVAAPIGQRQSGACQQGPACNASSEAPPPAPSTQAGASTSHSSLSRRLGNQCNILDTPRDDLLRGSGSSRAQRKAAAVGLLDTNAQPSASGVLESRGSSSILMSARGILDTGVSVLTSRAAPQTAGAYVAGRLPPLGMPERVPSHATPGLMMASARAMLENRLPSPTVRSPFQLMGQQALPEQEEEQEPESPTHAPSLCGLKKGPRESKPAPAAPDARAPLTTTRHLSLPAPEGPKQAPRPQASLPRAIMDKQRSTEAAPATAANREGTACSPGSHSSLFSGSIAWIRASVSPAPAPGHTNGDDSVTRDGLKTSTHTVRKLSSRPLSGASQLSTHDSVRSVSPPGGHGHDQKLHASASSISSASSLSISPQNSMDTALELPTRAMIQPKDAHHDCRAPVEPKESNLPAWVINPYQISFCSLPNGKLCRIGTGAFGTVYRGVYHDQPVAVKVCKHSQVNKRAMKLFQKEVSILHSCRHPNIVSFIGACTWQGGKRTVLLTSFMEKGDLYAALGRNPVRYCWNNVGKSIALDIAHGLDFLHSKNIVHFDLKSANILLNRSQRAQIADVGLAKTLTEYHNNRLATYMATADLGTFAWSAPEVLLGLPCDSKADIYSFGVVLWELATCEIPVGRDLQPIRVPEEGPPELKRLIMRCLRHDPVQRPTAAQIVRYLERLQ